MDYNMSGSNVGGRFGTNDLGRSKTVDPMKESTMNYMRAGTFIILQPDTEYRSIYPDDPQKIWTHHMFEPYAYLTRKQYMVPVGSGTK